MTSIVSMGGTLMLLCNITTDCCDHLLSFRQLSPHLWSLPMSVVVRMVALVPSSLVVAEDLGGAPALQNGGEHNAKLGNIIE